MNHGHSIVGTSWWDYFPLFIIVEFFKDMFRLLIRGQYTCYGLAQRLIRLSSGLTQGIQMIEIIKNKMTSDEEIQKTPNGLMKETWPRFTRRSS